MGDEIIVKVVPNIRDLAGVEHALALFVLCKVQPDVQKDDRVATRRATDHNLVHKNRACPCAQTSEDANNHHRCC